MSTDMNAASKLFAEIADLVIDAGTKIEEGFEDRSILEDLRHRLAESLLETPVWWTDRRRKDALTAATIGSPRYAYPEHCEACGMKPGDAYEVRLTGCDVCKELIAGGFVPLADGGNLP